MADSDFAVANLALLKIGASADLIGSFDDPSTEANCLKLLYPEKRDELLRSFKWPFAQRRAYPTQLGGSTYNPLTSYGIGAYVSYAPSASNVANMPESVSTFVYISLAAANLGNQPDNHPTKWFQVSRAAWAYCFVIPADVLQIHGLYHGIRNAREDQHVPYEVGNVAPLDSNGNPVGPGTVLFTDTGFPGEIIGDQSTPVTIELAYTAQITDTKQFPSDFTDALAWLLAKELCLSIRKDADEAARAEKAFVAAFGRAKANARQGIRPDQEPVPSHISARRGRTGWNWRR